MTSAPARARRLLAGPACPAVITAGLACGWVAVVGVAWPDGGAPWSAWAAWSLLALLALSAPWCALRARRARSRLLPGRDARAIGMPDPGCDCAWCGEPASGTWGRAAARAARRRALLAVALAAMATARIACQAGRARAGGEIPVRALRVTRRQLSSRQLELLSLALLLAQFGWPLARGQHASQGWPGSLVSAGLFGTWILVSVTWGTAIGPAARRRLPRLTRRQLTGLARAAPGVVAAWEVARGVAGLPWWSGIITIALTAPVLMLAGLLGRWPHASQRGSSENNSHNEEKE